MTGLEATVPIIEILGPDPNDYKALNDSTPIAELLNKRFTERDGYKDLKGVDNVREDGERIDSVALEIRRWIINDIYENALDAEDGSKEYFKTTREAKLKCDLKDATEVWGGGEAAVMQKLKNSWVALRDRMKEEDGSGERELSCSSTPFFSTPLCFDRIRRLIFR